MQTEKYVLPVRCKKCESVFDMWPDFAGKKGAEMEGIGMEVEQSLSESLCWKCRNWVVAIADEESEVDFMNSLLDED